MIDTAVIPVAGSGTRLLPFTKEQPKEMLPLFVKGGIKPTVQIIFEELYSAGIRKFIFIVGRGKRVIEDHFIPNYLLTDSLKGNGKTPYAEDLLSFYNKIEESSIVWINQSRPKGFGHAVSLARPYVLSNQFFVHAGDTVIANEAQYSIIKQMIESVSNDEKLSMLCIRQIKDKSLLRQYGVANLDGNRVIHVEEKPQFPTSEFALMPLYVFTRQIFEMLVEIKPGLGNEYQLTDAIELLIKSRAMVSGRLLGEDAFRMDVGTPETYYEALNNSYKVLR